MGRRQAAKKRQNHKASLTPATPRGHTSNATDTAQSEISAQDSLHPIATPPTSPSLPSTPMESFTAEFPPLEPSPSTPLESFTAEFPPLESTTPSLPSTPMESFTAEFPPLEPTISANDIISTDIVAIADMFATMKKAMLMMTSAFDRFEIQTEKLASLSLDIKAAEQVRPSSIVITELCRLAYIII
jgi:hypothetical protein